MGKRGTIAGKRGARESKARQGGPSRRPPVAVETARPVKATSPRRGRLAAIGVGALLLLGLLGGWGIHRQAASRQAEGAHESAVVDAREAELLRVVQTHPSQSRPHRELADYYLAHQRPFEALWELDLARELGITDEPLTLHASEALKRAGLPGAALRLLVAAHHDFHALPALDGALALTDLEVADPQAAAQVVRSNPSLRAGPDGLLLLARAHLALNDLPAARAVWYRARQAMGREPSPQQDERSLALGRMALALGDLPAARAELAAAARTSPDDEAAPYSAGLAYEKGGTPSDRAKAVDYFKQAVHADPHRARAGVELGRLLYEKPGQWQQAMAIYRRALSMDSGSLEAEEGLARCCTALKKPDEAVYHQARVRELEDRPEEALQLYRRWGQLRPERWDAVLRAAECWMDMGRYLDAAREVQRGLTRFPNHPELFSHLAQIDIRTDSRPEAARICDRWAPVDSTSGRPEWVRGQLAQKAMRDDEAIRWFEAAVRKNPGFGTFHASLGEALMRGKRPERLRQARAELERAVALDPGMSLFRYQLGLVLQQWGDLDGARQAFLQALDRDSARLDAYPELMALARQWHQPSITAFFATLERQARDQQREESAARLDLSTQPHAARAQLALARLLLRRGALLEASHHLAIAAEQPDGAAARPLLQQVQRLLSVL